MCLQRIVVGSLEEAEVMVSPENERNPSRETRATTQLHYLKARNKKTPQYEYRTIVVPHGFSRKQAYGMLTLEAETGKWELVRTVIYNGGLTKYFLRRRVLTLMS